VIGELTIKQLVFWAQHQKYQVKPTAKRGQVMLTVVLGNRPGQTYSNNSN